jgi:phosphohistidine phosphatase
MSRRITLVRHAHAQWPAWSGRDFDRPLTARGLDEALATGRQIRAAGQIPELILASPARRTLQTAQIIATELGLPDSALQLIEPMYNASAAVLEKVLRGAGPATSHVLLVAHNPGISELARRLRNDPRLPFFSPAQWLDVTADM